MYSMLAENNELPEMKAIKWFQQNRIMIFAFVIVMVVAIISYSLYMYKEPSYEFILRDKTGSLLQCNKTDDTSALCSVFYCAESEGIFTQQYCYELGLTQVMDVYVP